MPHSLTLDCFIAIEQLDEHDFHSLVDNSCSAIEYNDSVLSQWTQGIPIEVAPFAYAKVLQNLSHLGSPTTSDASVSGGKILTLRMGKAKAGPVVSDNGNFIIDAPFNKEMMKDPEDVSGSGQIRCLLV